MVFGQHIEMEFSLPFSWKIFFFCALFFGIANIIVITFRPRIIKDHLSYTGFIGDGKGEDHLNTYSIEIGGHYRSFSETPEHLRTHVESREDYIKNNFWSIYNESNSYRLFWRITCSIFYVLGFILFGWVLIRNVIWVISAVI